MQKNIKIGKVSKYDNYLGEITTEDNIYYFTKNDVIDNIKENDLVFFKSKIDETFPQAYYIKLVVLEKNE